MLTMLIITQTHRNESENWQMKVKIVKWTLSYGKKCKTKFCKIVIEAHACIRNAIIAIYSLNSIVGVQLMELNVFPHF